MVLYLRGRKEGRKEGKKGADILWSLLYLTSFIITQTTLSAIILS